jgi:3-oxoacyl-[acyl-carrier-protein] synthase-3
MPFIRPIIAGTGSAVPARRLTNDDLSNMVETSDDWITQRTGIRERRIAGDDESTAVLGTEAARRALEAAGLLPGEIDLIVCATITPEMVTPATACFIAARLGLTQTPAFDLSAACSGFVYALDTAGAFIASGRYRNVLVVGAETISRITDYKDRGSCILFGDGAGAVVLRASDESNPGPKPRGLLSASLHADGNGWELIYCKPGSRHPVSAPLVEAGDQYLKLKGREVFKFAVTKFVEMVEVGIEKAGLSLADVKLIIPHQSNLRIIEAAMEKLGLPVERAMVNIDRYGNTSAASIAIALDEAVRTGKLTTGDVAVMVGIGGGLTWSSAVVRL